MPSVSVVIPSLNEEKTIASCIEKALSVFDDLGIDGEVIVADNSTDRTPKIATSLGAKVVTPTKMGYGSAYLKGLSSAEGEYIVIADADATYNFLEMPKFLEPLMNGDADFVMGTRLKGDIKDGAMPWLHLHIGNPLLTKILNVLFKMNVSDTHCGMRAFTREALEKMNLRSTGMEFASEMIIEAARTGLRISEVPITYYPRLGSPSKLSSFSDGWRHIRFMMLYNPVPFLFVPGFFLFIFGLLLTLTLLIQGNVVETNLHSLILGSLLAIIGFQTIIMGIYTRVYAIVHGLAREEGFIKRFLDYHSLEMELFVGAGLFLIGLITGTRVLITWIFSGYGALSEVGSAVISMVLATIGIMLIFSALFVSLLLLDKEE
ncbi:MAG: glycosyltransferase family 2 protein [Halobacteriota archaeon]|nr:glycosyltransferase family 2 protein [Halobacteriota archaeon]